VCAALPDKRRGRNRQFVMADIGMAAFSVFFMQCPSFLAHQRQLLEGQGRSNCHRPFQMTNIPCDHCPRCSTVTKGNKTEYFHSMVQASLVAPGYNRARFPASPASQRKVWVREGGLEGGAVIAA
jgi:hypothetical protein